MTSPVVRQGDDFVPRLMHTVQTSTGFRTVAVLVVFVNVISQMDDDIDVGVVRNGLISVEVPKRVVGTAGHADDKLVEPAVGQGHRAADRRRCTQCFKLVIVSLTWCKARRHDLHGEVAIGARSGHSGRDELVHVGVE